MTTAGAPHPAGAAGVSATAPRSWRRAAFWRRIEPGGVAMAVLALVWHMLLMGRAANDNFMHMSMAQHWLAGDWPVRDFFDNGRVLQYALSALAQASLGDRLLGEALIVGLAWAISAYLVFVLVRRLTGSLPAAIVASLLLIVAGARGYNYPKGIVYAGAAALWWAYARRPAAVTIVAFGAWVAVAYFWRPDHGVYAAIALVLAVAAAHGIRRETATRIALAGATTLALVAPFWIYVHATVGLPEYVQTGVVAARVEHGSHGPHEWPFLRLGSRALEIEPPEAYAPIVGVRWTAASDPEAREAVRARYGLTSMEVEGESERVRLSARSIPGIPALVREPIVEDTAGIDRSSGTLLPATWPRAQRWAFEHAWLRLRVLPDLDAHARAVEYMVALFLLLPAVLLAASPWIAARLAPGTTVVQLAAFALFTLVVAFAMLRQPFAARAADAVVLSGVALALCTVSLWRAGAGGWSPRAIVPKAGAVVLALVTTAVVARAGEFGAMFDGLVGQWTSLSRAAGAWAAAGRELTVSPPLAFYVDRPARPTLRLAAYARACLPPAERMVVLWFEPEIPYFSGRLLAQRHFNFPPGWAHLAHEQDATLEKLRRYRPPLAFGLASALDRTARVTYPGVVELVEREYRLAATFEAGGEEYLIFARKDRPVVAHFGPHEWPCFDGSPSPWSRVGVPDPPAT